jgi:hypothetical protein
MNVQEIDDHVDNFTAAEAPAGFNEAQLKLFDICQVWQKVRPIVKFARNMLFWRPKWQDVVDQFIAAADLSCPV